MAGPPKWRRARVVTATAVVLLFAACSDRSPSALRPAGPGARRIAELWWVLFWAAAVVCVIVIGGVLLAVVRRRRSGDIDHREPTRFVMIAGVAVPFVVLATVFGLSLPVTLSLIRPAGQPQPSSGLTIQVVGHQWWWEVRYPDGGPVTANEIHIPTGTDVLLQLSTADVLHSFWVPQLIPKTDMIAGRTNTAWIRADHPGQFRGQCAEYCGMQHAHMAFMVIAQPRDEYNAWLRWAGSANRPPTDPAAAHGLNVFAQTGCGSCHTVRGTGANGKVGPDLSTVGDRWSIGAGTVPNTPGDLRNWISNPQQLKPGVAMPPQPVSPADMPDLIAYLGSLSPPPQGAP